MRHWRSSPLYWCVGVDRAVAVWPASSSRASHGSSSCSRNLERSPDNVFGSVGRRTPAHCSCRSFSTAAAALHASQWLVIKQHSSSGCLHRGLPQAHGFGHVESNASWAVGHVYRSALS